MTLSKCNWEQKGQLDCAQKQQKLSTKEEEVLVDYIQHQTKAGYCKEGSTVDRWGPHVLVGG